MKTAPVRSAYSWAAASVSSTTSPCSRTSAPYSRVAATLGSGAPTGMKTVERTPSRVEARATPWAWLPALAATTPAARSSGESPAIRTYAPRSLKEPVRWRFSHLRWTGAPTSSERWRLPSIIVTLATPASIFCAPRTSSSVTLGGWTALLSVMAPVWLLERGPRYAAPPPAPAGPGQPRQRPYGRRPGRVRCPPNRPSRTK